MNKFKKLVFLPDDLFKGFTDKRLLLYIGIFLVGIRDMGLNLFSYQQFGDYFKGKSPEDLLVNIIIAAIAIVLIGTIDVLFYCIPLSDLFRLFKRREKIKEPASLLIKLMKAYILANMLVTPLDALGLYISNNPGVVGSEALAGFLIFALGIASLVWFFATIIRGANVIYDIPYLYRLLTVPAVILWMELLGSALDFIYRQWIVVLFR